MQNNTQHALSKPRSIHRILLLNPFLYSDRVRNVGVDPVAVRHSGQEIKNGVVFPIGLAYMGAVLRQAGFEIRILDPIAQRSSSREIETQAEWADMIVMPFSPAHGEDTRHFFTTFRHKARVLTGEIAVQIGDYLLHNDVADLIIDGEPEDTILEVCRLWPSITCLPGTITRNPAGNIEHGPERPLIEDLDRIPFPLRDFAHPSLYWDIAFWGEPTAFIMPTRGCPFDCVFCAQHRVNRRRVRRRSVSNIVDEIEHIVCNLRVRNIMFFDETTNLDDAYITEFCREILARKLREALAEPLASPAYGGRHEGFCK